jgi:hypothetical protein
MLSNTQCPEVGVVGVKLLFPDRIKHGGVILGVGGVTGHAFNSMLGSSPGYMDLASESSQLCSRNSCMFDDAQRYF